MANTYNKATLFGRIVEVPELKEYPGKGDNDGFKVIHMRVMTNWNKRNPDFDPKQDKSDDNKPYIDIPEGHDVEIWNQTAQYVVDYAKKGQQIFITGRMKPDSYDDENFHNDKNEVCRRRRVVIVADRDGVSLGAEPRGSSGGGFAQTDPKVAPMPKPEESPDDIPF